MKSNESEPIATDGEIQVPDEILTNTIYPESTMTSTIHPNQHIPLWTSDASLPGDQGRRNTSKSEGADCMCPLVSVGPTGGFLSTAIDAHKSQSLTDHTGKAPLIAPGKPSTACCSAQPSLQDGSES